MNVLERPNRGLLLDIVAFAVNLACLFLLSGPLEQVVRRAAADEQAAMTILFAISVALFVLAPAGATLKRWHFHRRREAGAAALDIPSGCLFNPIMYFCLVAVIFATVNAFVLQRVYGNREPPGTVFVSSILLGIVLIITHTVLVYRFFSPPRHPPRSPLLRSPTAELAGDACLFANMLVFQLIWNLLTFAGIGRPSGIAEALGRLAVFAFLALLLYFPPRMFYYAEEGRGARAWLSMLVANSPVIARLVAGSGA